MKSSNFTNETVLIDYSPDDCTVINHPSSHEILLPHRPGVISWLNTYGTTYYDDFKTIIHNNQLDEFLIKLLQDTEQSNRLIELDDGLIFISLNILKSVNDAIISEQMFFIGNSEFIWSIQEKAGDYFEWIRERIRNPLSMVRRKKADYLFYLMIESVLDNYEKLIDQLSVKYKEIPFSEINPTPEYAVEVEEQKNKYFEVKKATQSLRDMLIKFEKLNNDNFDNKYFNELKEQSINLMNEIDFELMELDSKINLIFNFQGYRLNEVMKTLTIFSVIFIPLTFIAGLYGMNFTNIPELQNPNGYYIVLVAMFIIAVATIVYFRMKKW